MGKLLITMSGGTTTVINAMLAGILQSAQRKKLFSSIIAGVPGVTGALSGSLVSLDTISESAIDALKSSPGSAFIGTTRIAPLSDEELGKLRQITKKEQISHFINIGGNGTIKQTMQIAKALPHLSVAAAPKTVDNDLGDAQFKSVLFTPGFPSCVNFWVQKMALLNNENLGACSHDKVLIAQTFGRETGFLAGAARLADASRDLPLLLLLPEDAQPLEKVIGAIKETVSKCGRAMVVMSEGYPIGDIGSVRDAAGQVMYGSSENHAAQLLVTACARAGLQARSYIPTIDQRQDPHSTVQIDRESALEIGVEIVKLFGEGDRSFFMASSSEVAGASFKTSRLDLNEISNFSRKMPPSWISTGRFDVSDEYIAYLQTVLRTDRAGNIQRYYEVPLVAPITSNTQADGD